VSQELLKSDIIIVNTIDIIYKRRRRLISLLTLGLRFVGKKWIRIFGHESSRIFEYLRVRDIMFRPINNKTPLCTCNNDWTINWDLFQYKRFWHQLRHRTAVWFCWLPQNCIFSVSQYLLKNACVKGWKVDRDMPIPSLAMPLVHCD